MKQKKRQLFFRLKTARQRKAICSFLIQLLGFPAPGFEIPGVLGVDPGEGGVGEKEGPERDSVYGSKEVTP